MSNKTKLLNRLLVVALAMTTVTLITSDYVFDRIQPLIYLRTQSKVSLGVSEYDLNFAYSNPCKIFEQNIRTHLPEGAELTKDQIESLKAFTTNCNGLYELEWAKEIRQLLRVELPRFPSEYKKQPSPEPYREPRHKRDTDKIAMRNLTNDEQDEINYLIKEAKIKSKLDQLFIMSLYIGEPHLLSGELGPKTTRRLRRAINHSESILHNEDVSDMLVFNLKEIETVRLDPKQYKAVVRNATLRHYEGIEKNYTRGINNLLRAKHAPAFFKTVLKPEDYDQYLVQRNNETILKSGKALKSNVGIREDIAQYLASLSFNDHMTALDSIKEKHPNILEVDELINHLRRQGTLSQIQLNNINIFSLYEKLRYFFVPFLEHPEMEERILEQLDKRLLSPKPGTTSPTRKSREVQGTIDDYSVYDAFNETVWDNDDWLNEPIETEWFTNECVVESAMTLRRKAYANRLGRLSDSLKKLSVNELFILRIGNLNRIAKREAEAEPWSFVSYLTVACALWMYPIVCDIEKSYHWDSVIENHKKEIRGILYQPAIEELLRSSSKEWTLPNEPEYNRRPKRQVSEFGALDSEMTQLFRSPTTTAEFKKFRATPIGVKDLIRPRRNGILSEMVSQITTQTIGVITGNIVTNLVTSAIELINPYSNTNRIGKLEAAYEEMKNNFDNIKLVDRGILENLDKLSNVVQETVERLDAHIKLFPEYSWLSSLIINRMTSSALDLQRVTDEARRGRIAVEPFARLTGIVSLKEVDSLDTKLVSISKINDHAINFKFRVMVEAHDTHVERVRAFKHWDNLDDVPRLLSYNGAEFIIRNETNNCVKAISGPPDRYVSDQCLEQDGEDPALSQWNTDDQTEDLGKYVNDSQVIKTMAYNYVYCFPGKIRIEQHTYRCPPDVFRLKPKLEFQTAKQKHTPTKIAIESSQDMAIETVHAGHFPDDSDVVQRLALFDSLRSERKKLREKLDEENNSITIRKHGAVYWSVMTFLIATSMGAAAYVAYVCYAHLKRMKRPMPSAAPQTPSTYQASSPAYPNASTVAYSSNRLGEDTVFIR